jgi:large subunit ribosomal protein L30
MSEKITGSTLEITLTKSLIGRKKVHIATAKSLGLTKIGETVIQPKNDATIGKIKEISYMVTVKEQEVSV